MTPQVIRHESGFGASRWLDYLPLILSVCIAGCGDTSQESPSSEPSVQSLLVIEGAAVFDGTSDELIEDAVLVIEGDRIQQIGSRGEVKIPAQATMRGASGKTIIPTLLDLHVHIGFGTDEGFHVDYYTADNLERDAQEYLDFGIGHILSMGFDRQAIFEVGNAQRAGERGGAQVLTAGRGFSPPGGFTVPVPLGNSVESEWMNRPGSIEQARRMVQMEAAKDVDVLKMWIDDVNGTVAKFDPQMYGAIIEEAHRHDIKVVAHVFELEDAKELMRRGVDALTHVVTVPIDQEFLTLASENNVVQIFTLARYTGDERFRTMFGNARRMVAAGIPLALGSDTGSPGTSPGSSAHQELELLVQAGLTPQRALRAGTRDAARFLGIDDAAGTLEPGKQANFIILNADPTIDITNTRNMDAVWFRGQVVERSARLLEEG